MYLLVFIALVCFILLSSLVKAPPPEPHNVEGRILTNSSNGVQNGIPVLINNTVTGDTVRTEVNAPPVPQLRGSYSATIDGVDGDLIVVTSWNITHFGNNTANLESTTTTVDVKLNYTRPSEANVTILEPLNDTLKNKSFSFNVTANITILGNDGVDCNATISFSNRDVLNISSGENYTNVLGNIPFENFKLTNWSVTSLNDGFSDITVTVSCDSDGRNFEHLSTKTVSNITIQNLAPIVNNIALDTEIDLIAGSNLTILCNASINDDNTISDIKTVNATFYQESIGSTAVDDNNNHYSNSSCVNVSSSAFQSNYTCGFKVAYYANNGTWQCNITTIDFSNATDFSTTLTSVNELLAIDVTPSMLDYGNLVPTETSLEDVNVTITNFGNIPFNTSIRAFAPNESMAYLNLSMTCENGNISNANQRFSIFNGTAFTDMTKLNNETQLIQNFTRPQRTDDLTFGNDTNSTFWKLQLPVLTSGVCNGTVLFGAIPT